MRLPAHIIKLIRDTETEVKAYVRKIVEPGDVLTWRVGPYAGRKARVESVHWDEWSMTIYVFVVTFRRDGQGILSPVSPIHRTGHTLDLSFEKVGKDGTG